jgi:hypothetical protein
MWNPTHHVLEIKAVRGLSRLGWVLILAAGTLLATVQDARSVSYYLCTDVPATLGGTDHDHAILRSDGGLYSVELNLPGGDDAAVAALERRSDGLWLLAGDAPFLLPGNIAVQPHDVVATSDGMNFAVFFDGTAAGIPGDAGIDALFRDSGGNLVFSFNVPVNLGGVEYGPSDLVRYSAGVFSLFWSAAAAGVPADANVVGADRDGAGDLVITFDVPTNLGGIDYLPGQLVRWNSKGFSSYFADPAWPAYAQLRDFSFVPAAGTVPDGAGVPGVPLTVSLSAGSMTLNWGSSCAVGDTDYEVYEGALTGPFTYTHAEKLCTTGGLTATTFPAPAGNAYYLIVPRDGVSEGSYGQRSGGAELPQGTSACLPQQIAAACP